VAPGGWSAAQPRPPPDLRSWSALHTRLNTDPSPPPSLVVTPLLERVAGAQEVEAAKKELADLLAKAAEEAKKEEAAKKVGGQFGGVWGCG
jgi:hypothetical protein